MNTNTPTAPVPALAGIVDAALREAGLSRLKVSEKSGIPRATLIRRLAGQRPFDIEELIALAALCNAKVSDWIAQAERAA